MTKEKVKKYADKKGFILGDDVDSIIDTINNKNGLCPCKFLSGTKCFCPEHLKEIREMGQCHCGLFFTKEKHDELHK